MTRDIDNTADVLDSRDIIARIEDLRGTLAECGNCGAEFELGEAHRNKDDDLICPDCGSPEVDRDGCDLLELRALGALADECEGYGDWEYGETLIRDSYFEEYAQELAEDIGAIPRDLAWPACHIDWEAAANALKMDYMSVDFDGVTYWMRA